MEPKPAAGTSFEISDEILMYLLEHPDAQDTLEGIIGWWLVERQVKFGADLVQETLTQLVAQGFVHERKGGDRRTHYHVNQQRLEDIRVLLKRKTQ